MLKREQPMGTILTRQFLELRRLTLTCELKETRFIRLPKKSAQ